MRQTIALNDGAELIIDTDPDKGTLGIDCCYRTGIEETLHLTYPEALALSAALLKLASAPSDEVFRPSPYPCVRNWKLVQNGKLVE